MIPAELTPGTRVRHLTYRNLTATVPSDGPTFSYQPTTTPGQSGLCATLVSDLHYPHYYCWDVSRMELVARGEDNDPR